MWNSRPPRRTRAKASPSRELPLVFRNIPLRGPATISEYACPLTASAFSPFGALADVVEPDDESDDEEVELPSVACSVFVLACASRVENRVGSARLAALAALVAASWTGLVVDGSTCIVTLVDRRFRARLEP